MTPRWWLSLLKSAPSISPPIPRGAEHGGGFHMGFHRTHRGMAGNREAERWREGEVGSKGEMEGPKGACSSGPGSRLSKTENTPKLDNSFWDPLPQMDPTGEGRLLQEQMRPSQSRGHPGEAGKGVRQLHAASRLGPVLHKHPPALCSSASHKWDPEPPGL